MTEHAFSQVDVFATDAFSGNPLAVISEAQGLTDAQLQATARWLNLSETTFLLPPTDPSADFRVRIFTPAEELPFAGHPTLGSAHAWLEAGGTPRTAGLLVQECGVGLVQLRSDAGRLAFAAPPLSRYEPVDEGTLQRIMDGLQLSPWDVLDSSWLVNGPEWIGLRLASARTVLEIEPNWQALGRLKVGVVGPHAGAAVAEGSDAFEIRTFVGDGSFEDPVTGSFNAGVARWLIDAGHAPSSYTARQGTRVGHAGRIHILQEGADIWVGGHSETRIRGSIRI